MFDFLGLTRNCVDKKVEPSLVFGVVFSFFHYLSLSRSVKFHKLTVQVLLEFKTFDTEISRNDMNLNTVKWKKSI